MKQSKINFEITLDEDNIPEKISWDATEKPDDGPSETNAINMSGGDPAQKNTRRIDLWTKEMTVNEMQIHFYQMLIKMADTFQRATNNSEAVEMIRKFSSDFAQKFRLNSI